MIYLCNPCGQAVCDAMSAGELACLTTPKQGNAIPPGAQYACDNGRFGKGWVGYERWWAWVVQTVEENDAERCLFAAAPDVVADAWLTFVHSYGWLSRIRALGIPAAFIAQDGCQASPWLIPWDELDVLFIGGSTKFKLASADLCREAVARGKRVHIGRVNSGKRMQFAKDCGAESCDGTFLTFGPIKNLPRLRRWFENLH